MKVLNLGFGLQSFTLAIMMIKGVIPRADVAIFADTGWESAETYAFALEWSDYLSHHGLPVLWAYDWAAHGWIAEEWESTFIPAYTVNLKTGKRGILNRQCTERWKIAPIRKLIKCMALATHLPFLKWPQAFEIMDYNVEYGPEWPGAERNEFAVDAKKSLDIPLMRSAIINMVDRYTPEGDEPYKVPFKKQWFVDFLVRDEWHDRPPVISIPKTAKISIDRLISKGKQEQAAARLASTLTTLQGKVKEAARKYELPRHITPVHIDQYFGITIDEIQRAKPSEVKWVTSHFPFLDLGMRRVDCATFLREHGFPIPGKSACVF